MLVVVGGGVGGDVKQKAEIAVTFVYFTYSNVIHEFTSLYLEPF